MFSELQSHYLFTDQFGRPGNCFLLLSALWDAAFDLGLVAFDEHGTTQGLKRIEAVNAATMFSTGRGRS